MAKGYTIGNKLLVPGFPEGTTGQPSPDSITAFPITALPETAAPNGVYDLTDSNYYAITTDVYWRYASSYDQMSNPERKYDFQNMSMIYQFNSNNNVLANYREMNFTVSTNIRSALTSYGSDLLPISAAFYPGVYLNSRYTTAGHYESPIPNFVNGPLSGSPTSVKLAGFHHLPDPENDSTQYYYTTGFGWPLIAGVGNLSMPWHKYKVIGDCSNGNISAFYSFGNNEYKYMGYTNMHSTITSVDGLYCYDYYETARGNCSAKDFRISGFQNFDDALAFGFKVNKVLAY